MRKHICFDLDGTLIDSASVVCDILNILRKSRGKSELAKGAIIPWVSLGGLDLIKSALEVNGLEAENQLTEFRRIYHQYSHDISTVYPGAEGFIRYLVDAGYALSICTNKPRSLALKALQDTLLSRYFEYILAGDDLPTKKPSGDNLLACIDACKSNITDTILIGDSTIDQKLAASIGVRFFHYTNGYDDGVLIGHNEKSFGSYKSLQENWDRYYE